MKYQYDTPRPGNKTIVYIGDRVALAEEALEIWGATYAMRFLPDLDQIIASQNWRREAAADVRQMIVRQFAIESGRMFERTIGRSTEFVGLPASEDRTTERVLQ